ncbi:solute carrier family 16 member 6b [Scleropages formosus]|nr:monocarboxylate transporter 7-like [Scleropages formosus]
MTGCLARVSRYMAPTVYPEVPDGGWGWVVAAAFFFVEVFTYGIIKSFGIFLPDLMEQFGESNSRVSWIISICIFVMTFTAPLASATSSRFGHRPVVLCGGFLVSLGTITTAFTNSVNEMYITMGIVSGLGYCLTFLPTVTILSLYFSRRRSLVTAVASTGESFCMFAFAPAFTAMKEQVGWRYCLLAMGVLQAVIMVCGALLRPIVIKPKPTQDSDVSEISVAPLETTYALENELTRTSITSADSGLQSLSTSCPNLSSEPEMTEEKPPPTEEQVPLRQVEEQPSTPAPKPQLLDFSVLRDGGFICYAMFGLFATLGFFAPQLYIIPLSVSRGVAASRAACMLSIIAVAEVFGRLSVGWAMGLAPVRKLHVLLGCVVLLAVVLAVFPAADGFWALSVCCVLYGFLLGTVASTHIPMLAEDDVVGVERMPSAAGVYVFIQSFAGLAGPPLGGYLVDRTKNYGSAFYSCAVGMGLGALFLGFVLPAKRAACCKSQTGAPGNAREADVTHEDTPVDFMEVDLVPDSPAGVTA